MDWIFFAVIAAVLTAASTITQKKTLLKEHAMEFSAVLALIIFLISLPLFLLVDYSRLDFVTVLILYLFSILGSFAFLLAAKSLRHMDISASSPLMTTGPAFVALFAFVFLNETLKLGQLAGIGLLIIGAYILETKKHHSLLEPLKEFISSKYIHYIIFALILYAACSVGDRLVLSIRGMQVEAYIAFVHLFLALNFFILISVFHDGYKGIKRGLKSSGWWIFLVAVFTLGYRLAQAQAVSMTYVALVSAIKRSSALFATIIGGELFKEKNLFRKSVACVIIVGGVLLIVL